MTTLTVSVEYGLGGYLPDQPNGNLLQTVTAEQAADGTWSVVTRDGAGTETARRDAYPDEATRFTAAITPPADTTTTDPAPAA